MLKLQDALLQLRVPLDFLPGDGADSDLLEIPDKTLIKREIQPFQD